MTVLHAEPFNRLTYSYGAPPYEKYCLTDL